MARRDVGEINAGSMADIAFLLLIFFLVTTTMEVDAGIGRQLPLKLDQPLPPDERIDINERNVLEIMANSNDDLLVEGKFIEIDELYDIVWDFYTVNKNAPDQNLNMPNYSLVDMNKCATEISNIKTLIEEDPENKLYKSELSKWETKMILCQSLDGNSYREMNKQAVIQLKNQAGTSYGLYIEIQNILKQVVNELRVIACEELDFPNYFELREDREEDRDYISKLRVLVPERIIEAKIDS
ncbi:MAG: biopolymer transport protein ExbD [Crocinitomix sp.]|jgi:biopolymer transport protein ExbD